MAKKPPIKAKLGAAGTEDEMLLAAKDWFKENGTGLAFGVVLGIAGIGGWKGWQHHQENYFNQAAELYLAYLENDQTNADNLDRLVIEYEDTPYPALAYLQRAFVFVENNELDKAGEDLQWVIENTEEEGLATIAKMRRMRVLLAQKKYQEVLDELNVFDYSASADVLAEEIRGDALAQLGRKQEAAAAYKKAREKALSPTSKELIAVKLSRVSQ